jgi:hypothetical protein
MMMKSLESNIFAHFFKNGEARKTKSRHGFHLGHCKPQNVLFPVTRLLQWFVKIFFFSYFSQSEISFFSGYQLFVCLMVFNATFNNISVISWRSVLLVEDTGGL